VRACAGCHLVNGLGYPENARVAGATADYLRRQLTDFRSGARKYSDSMIAIAKGLSEDDIRTASEYFANLQVGQWVRVVESDTVPRSFVGRGNARLPHPDGGTEALGNRIIELPEDVERNILLDPHSGFVAYVPPGSIAKGEALVAGSGGKTIACVICHGSTLSGIGDVPGIAGRSPVYIARQLYNIQDGSRGGSSAALMKAVVDKLNDGDILAISAYVASLKP
jgi:cytochrome c553